MARIKNIDVNDGEMTVVITISEKEYNLLGAKIDGLVLVPTDEVFLERELVTGKIGNGNRIMVPNTFLKNNGIAKLRKRVPSRLFEFNNEKYLFIKLENSSLVPEFEEDEGAGDSK
ncbi:hypothetical protein KKA03_00395 [archaeon]|nr:hypothetical protein [archaeon]